MQELLDLKEELAGMARGEPQVNLVLLESWDPKDQLDLLE